ncbi:MAG: hypothetical protein IJW98_01280 [Clostridia bacterium]|nr:hypothetical protein [Clostridia bacterium]
MKKLISCLLILSATAILLFSCADGDATDTTTTTEKLPDTNEPVTEPTAADLLLTKMQDAGCPADKLPTIERELNAEELEAIKVWIATEEVRALLGCYTFYSPETIELNGFIYGYQGEGHGAPEEEQTALGELLSKPDVVNYDVFKWTSTQLDEITRQYLGVPFNEEMSTLLQGEQRKDFPLPRVYYLSKYDSYYYYANDSYFFEPEYKSAWTAADGSYLIEFSREWGDAVVLLKPVEDGYLITMLIGL